ncbi:MAG TPA: hypothetical protein VF329_09515 [Gammaproteobacteria bacterium]
MKKIRGILLGVALALPLMAASAAAPTPLIADQVQTTKANAGPSKQYNCCWVFFMGRLYCFPC